ncbi:DUF86 domain-containing protein [Candidatus Poribacteria bacterium]|nr:DUF86 domain-containing protein [Candidatus Poribacteria bacterium]
MIGAMQISQASIEQAIKTVVVNMSPPVVAVYLFGSHATGKVWQESDVDVALLFGETDASNQREIIGRLVENLCQALGDIELDVVNLDEVPTHFAYEILRTGKLAFCANPHDRIQFEIGIFDKQMEEEPWQQIGRDYLMKRAKTRQMLKKGKDMIDRRRVEHLVSYVQEMLNRLQNQGGKNFEEFAEDFQAVDASLYELQTMLEAISDIAIHVVTGANLGSPNSRPEAIEMLAKNGIIPQELAEKISQAVRMRNIIVHHYPRVNLRTVYDVIQDGLGDIVDFCAEIVNYLDSL